jgi:hypothetical protein
LNNSVKDSYSRNKSSFNVEGRVANYQGTLLAKIVSLKKFRNVFCFPCKSDFVEETVFPGLLIFGNILYDCGTMFAMP